MMNWIARPAPWLLAGLASAAPALAGGSDSGGCAPHGGTPPRLAIDATSGGPGPRLVFDGGVGLGNGTAFLLLEDPLGAKLPRGVCLTGVRGTLTAPVLLDPLGGASWPLEWRRWNDPPTMRVVAWAPGHDWVKAELSNRVRMPPAVPEPGELSGGGQVVVTEFLKDPTFVGDTKGEWIELHNPTSVPVDVEGWSLSDHGSDFDLLDNGGLGIVVPPGGYVVIGRDADPAVNGGVAVDAVASFTLSNGADEIVLSKPNGTVVDEIVYDDGVTWPDDAGRSVSLDPTRLDAVQNDDGASWCHGTTPISGSNPDTGTPGSANDPC